MDINKLLENISSDVLSDESKQEIKTVFEAVVTQKVDAIVSERIEVALGEQDTSHAQQLEKLLETIDEDHSEKLVKLVQRLDDDHTSKLQEIVEHYERAMTDDAKNLAESLQTQISNFLDVTLDEVIPTNLLKEAMENTKAANMIQQIKEIVSLDPEFVNENIKEALKEGKQTIDRLKGDLNEVLKENVKLSTERSKYEAELLIEKKCKSLPTEKQQILRESLKGKSASYIKENFDLTLKMLEKSEKRDRKTEKDFIINESVARTVDTPQSQSAVKESGKNSVMDEYVSGLK